MAHFIDTAPDAAWARPMTPAHSPIESELVLDIAGQPAQRQAKLLRPIANFE